MTAIALHNGSFQRRITVFLNTPTIPNIPIIPNVDNISNQLFDGAFAAWLDESVSIPYFVLAAR